MLIAYVEPNLVNKILRPLLKSFHTQKFQCCCKTQVWKKDGVKFKRERESDLLEYLLLPN